jgi:hypothetical protein
MNTRVMTPVRAKKQIFRSLAVLAIAAVLLAGCNDSSPTAPRLNPTPPPAERNIWNLTVEVIGATGPDICFHRPIAFVGTVFHTTFTLLRNGNSVTFVPPDPIDSDTYTGTVNGANFTATSPSGRGGNEMCGYGSQGFSLSGSFSEDGNQLIATEVWLLTLGSGEAVTSTFRWSASRN